MRDGSAVASCRKPLVDAQPVHGEVDFTSPEIEAATEPGVDSGQADFMSDPHLHVHGAAEGAQLLENAVRNRWFCAAQGGCQGKDTECSGRWGFRPTGRRRRTRQDHRWLDPSRQASAEGEA